MLISPYRRAKGTEIFFQKYYIPPKKKLIRLSYLKPLIIYVGLFLFTLCSNNTVKAQETTLSCGSNFIASYCDINLTDTINNLKIDSIYGTNSISYGVTNSDLKDVLYEEDYQKCMDEYEGGDDCVDGTGSLKFAVFYPKTLNGSPLNCKFPALVMFHGGSFFECSAYDNEGARDICRQIAKRGFVVFDVEYRRGVLLHPGAHATPNDYQYISAQQILGIYRALQDARGALRSIIYMQRTAATPFGTTFNIDTNNIFIGGVSAGSVMALGTAYYEQQTQIDDAYNNVSSVLGSIDAPWYIGGNTLDYRPYIKGVLNMWGGLAIDKSYYNDAVPYFESNDYLHPMIAFQGRKDSTFPINEVYQYFSSQLHNGSNYKTETYCLVSGSSFTLPTDINNSIVDADAVSLGADSLYAILNHLNVRTEVYIDCQMEHGLDKDGTSPYLSEFGTNVSTETAVYKYIAGRAATFFVAVMNNTTGIARHRFIECTNTRVKCNSPAASASNCGYSYSTENTANCD